MDKYLKNALILIGIVILSTSALFVLNVIVGVSTHAYVEMYVILLLIIGALIHTTIYFDKAQKKIRELEKRLNDGRN